MDRPAIWVTFVGYARHKECADETQGINAYLKKLDIAKKWYKENWGLDMFELRKEVRQRQKELNNYIEKNVTIYDYQ